MIAQRAKTISVPELCHLGMRRRSTRILNQLVMLACVGCSVIMDLQETGNASEQRHSKMPRVNARGKISCLCAQAWNTGKHCSWTGTLCEQQFQKNEKKEIMIMKARMEDRLSVSTPSVSG